MKSNKNNLFKMQLQVLVSFLFASCVFSDTKIDLLPSKRECAVLSTKLIPGHYVLAEDYLYAVLIEYKKNGESTGHHCGGAVINKNYILTAAHCVTGNIISKYGNPYKLRFFQHDRNLQNRTYSESDIDIAEDSDIQEIIPHFGYKSDVNQYNDIALIRFAKKIEYLETICFEYHQTINNDRIELRRNRYSVIGWSITENDNGRTDKRVGFMETISNKDCAKVVNITLSENQFCATKKLNSGYDKEDDETCFGDSGGAIIHNGYNIDYYISGIESVRFTECNNKVAPIVYTNVTQYLPWIRDNLKP